MITVKKLKQLIKDLPDDAKCYAYEGERIGIAIYVGDGRHEYWWIDASENKTEETYTEGFKKRRRNESIKH